MATFRMLRVKATGQWAGPYLVDERFPDDGYDWANRVATTLGLSQGSLQVVDATDDIRSGEILEDPNVPPEPEPMPDVGNFKLAIFGTLGKTQARALAREYLEFLDALNARNWDVARAAIDDALGDGALTVEEHDTLLALWTQFNLPEPAEGI